MTAISKRESDPSFLEFLKSKFKLSDNQELFMFNKNLNDWKLVSDRPNEFGYIRLIIRYSGRAVPLCAHRLIWFLHYGKFPASILDHINRDKTDNRIENLREVSHSENHRNCFKNQGKRNGCSSKYVGVSAVKNSSGKFRVDIKIFQKQICLGLFNSEKEAAKTRDQYIIDHGLESRYKLNYPKNVTGKP